MSHEAPPCGTIYVPIRPLSPLHLKKTGEYDLNKAFFLVLRHLSAQNCSDADEASGVTNLQPVNLTNGILIFSNDHWSEI
jgi:hypothetical protein